MRSGAFLIGEERGVNPEISRLPAQVRRRKGPSRLLVSRGWAEREGALAHSLGGVAESFVDIPGLQVRIGL